MSEKIEKNYVQYKNEKSVYVNGKRVNFERFISDLEKKIRKGRCSSFNVTGKGYSYQLLDTDYAYSDYEVEIYKNLESDLNAEMNRLCWLANSEVMKKRYAKFKKDIYTKPKHIIFRNFIEHISDPFGLMLFIVPTGYIVSLTLAFAAITAIGSLMGNSVLFWAGFFKVVGVLNYPAAIATTLSALYTLFGTGVMSLKEMIDNDNYPYDEREKKKEQIKKEQVKEKTKKNEVTKVQGDNKNKVVSKKYVPVQTKEHTAVVSYLGQKYRELEAKRNKLIISGASREQIEDVTNEMNAIVYKVNSMMGLDNSVHTSNGPVRKLNK